MNFIYKLEKKLGKYSIKNLPLILALLFAFNYLLSVAAPDIYSILILSPYDIFVNHQFWRLVTWVFTTPGGFNEWTIISLVVLYFLGSSAERGMGTFMFNLYTLGSMLLNFITIMAVSAFQYFRGINDMNTLSNFVSGGALVNYLVPTSVFFAFAMA